MFYVIPIFHEEACREIQDAIRSLFLATELRDLIANSINGEKRDDADRRQKERSQAMFDRYGAGVVLDPERANAYVGPSRVDDLLVQSAVDELKPIDQISAATALHQQRVRAVWQGRTGEVDVRLGLLHLYSPAAKETVDAFIRASLKLDELVRDASNDSETPQFESALITLGQYKSKKDEGDVKLVANHLEKFSKTIGDMVKVYESAYDIPAALDRMFGVSTFADLTAATVQIQKALLVDNNGNACDHKHMRPFSFDRPSKRARKEEKPSDDGAAASSSSSSSSSAPLSIVISAPTDKTSETK